MFPRRRQQQLHNVPLLRQVLLQQAWADVTHGRVLSQGLGMPFLFLNMSWTYPATLQRVTIVMSAPLMGTWTFWLSYSILFAAGSLTLLIDRPGGLGHICLWQPHGWVFVVRKAEKFEDRHVAHNSASFPVAAPCSFVLLTHGPDKGQLLLRAVTDGPRPLDPEESLLLQVSSSSLQGKAGLCLTCERRSPFSPDGATLS